MTIRIEPIQASPQADEALEALRDQSYIGGGFTDPALVDTLRAPAVRSRGTVLIACNAAGTILGTVTIVDPDSPQAPRDRARSGTPPALRAPTFSRAPGSLARAVRRVP